MYSRGISCNIRGMLLLNGIDTYSSFHKKSFKRDCFGNYIFMIDNDFDSFKNARIKCDKEYTVYLNDVLNIGTTNHVIFSTKDCPFTGTLYTFLYPNSFLILKKEENPTSNIFIEYDADIFSKQKKDSIRISITNRTSGVFKIPLQDRNAHPSI